MTLRTIGDVRDLIAKHLPPGHRARPSWQHVVAELDKAAAGADPLDVSIALRMTLELQGVPCRPA